jgi:hypothetical protein
MKNIYLIIYYCITLLACNNSEEINHFAFEERVSTKNIIIDKLELEVIDLTALEQTSGVGFFSYGDGKLYFLDAIRFEMYECYLEKNKINKILHQGDGPSEIPYFQNYTYANGKHYFFAGWTVYIFDSQLSSRRSFVIDFNEQESIEELTNNPKIYHRGVYEVKYSMNQWTVLDDSTLLFNIESTHPMLNSFISEEYYKNGRIMAKLNTQTGTVADILGRRPSKYIENKFLPNFDNHHYHFTNDEFYLNFEIDEHIYVYDRGLNPVYSFGVAGKNMNTEYTTSNDVSLFNNLDFYLNDRKIFGYYYKPFCVPEKKLVFRTYITGQTENNESSRWRLQIYRETTLIGDVEVPNGFEIIYYNKQYIYASIEDASREDSKKIVQMEMPIN